MINLSTAPSGMYVWVRARTCVDAHVNPCIRVCMQSCVHAHICDGCSRSYLQANLCMLVSAFVYLHMQVHLHACLRACLCVCRRTGASSPIAPVSVYHCMYLHITACLGRLVNMGVHNLHWSASWADAALVREHGVKLLHAQNGMVEGGNLSSIDVKFSFPRSLRTSQGDSAEHEASLTLGVGQNRTVTMRLVTKPGSFSAIQSNVEPYDTSSHLGWVLYGGSATYRIVTHDKFKQRRTTSAPWGYLSMTVADADERETCVSMCQRQSCVMARKACCCFDQDDGTYMLHFDSKFGGVEANQQYKIKVIADHRR